MDRVKFGRALGFGARAAAKTLSQAADAAMSPNPTRKPSPTPAASQTASNPAPAPTPTPAAHAGNVASASKRMGRAVFEPVKRHSRIVGLQVSGLFFALLALGMTSSMWAMRGSVHIALQAAHTNRAALWGLGMLKFYVAVVAVLMFAYFSISNFVRAGRSETAPNADKQRR